MIIGIPKEIHKGERRVATTPAVTEQLLKLGFSVWIETDAGSAANFSDEAYQHMFDYRWGGNVRELEKVVKRAVILANEKTLITPDLLLFDSSAIHGKAEKDKGVTLSQKIQDLEKDLISRSLVDNSWNRKAVSRALDISYPTLLSKIRKYRITEKD